MKNDNEQAIVDKQVKLWKKEIGRLRDLVEYATDTQNPLAAGFDYERVHAWMTNPNRKAANLAFTEGENRNAAYLIEDYDDFCSRTQTPLASAVMLVDPMETNFLPPIKINAIRCLKCEEWFSISGYYDHEPHCAAATAKPDNLEKELVTALRLHAMANNAFEHGDDDEQAKLFALAVPATRNALDQYYGKIPTAKPDSWTCPDCCVNPCKCVIMEDVGEAKLPKRHDRGPESEQDISSAPTKPSPSGTAGEAVEILKEIDERLMSADAAIDWYYASSLQRRIHELTKATAKGEL